MQDYQYEFIKLALANQVLRFGEFTLKSGRISPYFFNAGLFNSGEALTKLGRYYAAAIEQAAIDYDLIFGPAYKGIPLASATAIALYEQYNKNVAYCFNRKVAKDHGEGGNMVGAPLAGKVLIVDDVMTAGTAIRESMAIISKTSATLAGVVVALDRQERGQNELSAIQEVKQQYQVPVVSIIKLDHLFEYLEEQNSQLEVMEKLTAYRAQYGVS